MNRKILVLVDDLFWRTKIEHATKSAQAGAIFLSDPAELPATIENAQVCAVLVDLAMRKEPFDAIAGMKKKAKTKDVPAIGYYEHVRKDLKEKAEKAGFDQVLPRSTFSQNLADLVLKFALPGSVKTDEEEAELPEE